MKLWAKVLLGVLLALLLFTVCQAFPSNGSDLPTAKQQQHFVIKPHTTYKQLPSRGGDRCAKIRTAAPAKMTPLPFVHLTMFWNAHVARWCYDGVHVTWSKFYDEDRWTASWTFWHWVADFDRRNGPPTGSTYRYHRAKHEWQICILWPCLSRTTLVTQTVRGDGTYSADGYIVP